MFEDFCHLGVGSLIVPWYKASIALLSNSPTSDLPEHLSSLSESLNFCDYCW